MTTATNHEAARPRPHIGRNRFRPVVNTRWAFGRALGWVLGFGGLACEMISAAEPPVESSPARPVVVHPVPPLPAKIAGTARPRNIVLVLTDDHRYDALGCLGHPFLETPHLDRLAKEGVICRNAFVTTALCSPSRASILTGQYAHRHGVINNNEPVSPNLVFFPQYLKQVGYQTGFFGKWHMGNDDDNPQRGFDRWVSFRGQGVYEAGKQPLNVDGKAVPRKGYVTDELTDYALDWLGKRDKARPFFMYLSHKAVHAEFTPAPRHAGKYKDKPVPQPLTMALPSDETGRPLWVQNQRNSWHGVEFPYHSRTDLPTLYRNYCETLLAVDDSVGRLVGALKDENILDSTLILYMGDNGFAWGEHGLIDKRTAYEESMRVPMLMRCPEMLPQGQEMKEVVANIDVAPTFLAAAGLETPKHMDGRSFLPAAQGKPQEWRDALLYEYFWERNFPHTPTMHAVRTSKYKYIHYYGVWDSDELFDLEIDPLESKNLIRETKLQPVVKQLNGRLFDILEESEGMFIPLYRDRGGVNQLRRAGGSGAAPFPPATIVPEDKIRTDR